MIAELQKSEAARDELHDSLRAAISHSTKSKNYLLVANAVKCFWALPRALAFQFLKKTTQNPADFHTGHVIGKQARNGAA